MNVLAGFMLNWIRKILGWNVFFWALLAAVMVCSVDWRLCTIQRGRYLLGIFYNGFYQNSADGTVYRDYLKTHGITHDFIQKNL